MFGFPDGRAAAIDEAERYIAAMFAGLGGDNGALPTQVFADPYVTGFLQVLTVHSAAVVYQFGMPDQAAIDEIMIAAVDRLLPTSGAVLQERLAEFVKPDHPLHAEYLAGRQDGAEHVRGLLASDEIARNQRHQAFRAFVERRYL